MAGSERGWLDAAGCAAPSRRRGRRGRRLSTTELVLLLLLLLPLATLATVSAGVAALALFARRVERGQPRDERQERAFADLPVAGPARVGVDLCAEGWFQTYAFALQVRHRLVPYRTAQPTPGGGPPVILAAGYLENAGQMWPLARHLAARGFQPVLLDFPSTLLPIADNAAFLARQIDATLAASGHARAAFVGHSMAGVIARTYLAREASPRLAVVVSIASPHRGTRLARFGLGAGARDLLPGSPHLDAIPPRAAPGPVPVHTLISPMDNIVAPSWSTVLGEGEDVVLSRRVGHTGPLFLGEVRARIVAWLEVADYGPPRPEPAAAEPRPRASDGAVV